MPECQTDQTEFIENDGMCDCGKNTWEMCDCGKFFLDWICGYDPSTGQCSMAGTEDCDWDCPRGL